jgi:hypothetical protein
MVFSVIKLELFNVSGYTFGAGYHGRLGQKS